MIKNSKNFFHEILLCGGRQVIINKLYGVMQILPVQNLVNHVLSSNNYRIKLGNRSVHIYKLNMEK